MTARLFLRREDKHHEHRTPICPKHVGYLRDVGIGLAIQPSAHRIFSDEDYVAGGAVIAERPADDDVVIGLKEIELQQLCGQRPYCFFSHTIKGQPHNMPMLRQLIAERCSLIDYERIVDDYNRRLVFFGHFAGLAGMIDTLAALGQRLAHEGYITPLSAIRYAPQYPSLVVAIEEIKRIGQQLQHATLPAHLTPLVIGVCGRGNVSQGAQHILDMLGARPLKPSDLLELPQGYPGIYRVVFQREHTVAPKQAGVSLSDYPHHPERFVSAFGPYLPYLHVLVNGIYWDERCPRLLSLSELKKLYATEPVRLKVIGDLSCDINGAIQATVKPTAPDNPVYVYDVATGETIDGVQGNGPVILAVYNLPAEFPREASEAFSEALLPFLPSLAATHWRGLFPPSRLAPPLQRAAILYRGEFTAPYDYLRALV